MRTIALEYHDVVASNRWNDSGFPGTAAATYKLDVDLFARHVAGVEQAGVPVVNDLESIPLSESVGRPVLWTFDDGGVGYLQAADLLERRGWRGFVFVTTGSIGRPGFLSAADIRALHSRGHTIGSHSRTHPMKMSLLADGEISEEWRTSTASLEDVLGQRVRTGSVPGGYFSDRVASLASQHGITTLFTSEPVTRIRTIDGCTVVGRFTLRQTCQASYVVSLIAPMPGARAVQWLRWNAKKAAKSLAGGAYDRVREHVLGR